MFPRGWQLIFLQLAHITTTQTKKCAKNHQINPALDRHFAVSDNYCRFLFALPPKRRIMIVDLE